MTGTERRQPAVYILASRPNGTLYTGVTSDLIRRIWEHKNDLIDGFSRRYGVLSLIYHELHDSMESAIAREKQLKAGSRQRKLALIQAQKPNWKELYDDVL